MSGTDIGAIFSGVAALIPAVLACLEFAKKRVTKKSEEEIGARRRNGTALRLRYVWLSVSAVFLAITSIGLVSVPRVLTPTLEINITYPEDGSATPIETAVSGYASRELSSEQHLYIVVEYGGRWWPQSSEVTVGYSQASQRYEFDALARIGKDYDTGKTFIIQAVLVDSLVHQLFQGWQKKSTITGEWQGIPINKVNNFGKVDICDRITVKR